MSARNAGPRSRLWLGTIVFGTALAACGSGDQVGGWGIKPLFSASPTSIQFALDNNAPIPVHLSRAGAIHALTFHFTNPVSQGRTASTIDGSNATFSVIPIGNGTTKISVVDSDGGSATISAAGALCGRPQNLFAAYLLYPNPGATGVSTTVGTLYFEVYAYAANPNGATHLVVGGDDTLEGGALYPATPPPGSAYPTPIPWPTGTSYMVSYMAAHVPALAAHTSYAPYLYNDTCQPPVGGQTFST